MDIMQKLIDEGWSIPAAEIEADLIREQAIESSQQALDYYLSLDEPYEGPEPWEDYADDHEPSERGGLFLPEF